jgi:hypothetical protein
MFSFSPLELGYSSIAKRGELKDSSAKPAIYNSFRLFPSCGREVAREIT